MKQDETTTVRKQVHSEDVDNYEEDYNIQEQKEISRHHASQ